MTLLALIVALLLEQVRPLPVRQFVLAPLGRVSALLLERFNDEKAGSGRVVWVVVVLLAAIASALAFLALDEIQPLLGLLFNIAVLYLTMGFRHESHYFSDIHLALRMNELDRARELISEWRGTSHAEASASEVARLAIEQALLASHRNVFGVCFWFVLLPGPSGAVLYRLARFLADDWSRKAPLGAGGFSGFAEAALEWLDWIPVRLTAIGFSIAGNFEDAVYCWRSQALQWPRKTEGILISSGAGAMGVRLGLPVHADGLTVDRPEMGTGEEASADLMQSTIGLVWRTLVLCLLLLALLGIAGWVGG